MGIYVKFTETTHQKPNFEEIGSRAKKLQPKNKLGGGTPSAYRVNDKPMYSHKVCVQYSGGLS